jgi:hypothetical protein
MEGHWQLRPTVICKRLLISTFTGTMGPFTNQLPLQLEEATKLDSYSIIEGDIDIDKVLAISFSKLLEFYRYRCQVDISILGSYKYSFRTD